MSLISSYVNHRILSISAHKKVEIKENGEVILLREGLVEITDRSARIGQKTYAISKIHSVRVHIYEPKLFLSVFFILVVATWSTSVAMSHIDTYSQTMTVGLVIGLVGLIFLILSTKTKYSVRIRSSDGELDILESSDKNFVGRTAHAINKAVFLREFN